MSSDNQEVRSGFCTHCGHSVDDFSEHDCCPNCGSRSRPCFARDQVTVSINLRELWLVCLWAEQWAMFNRCDVDLLYAIAVRLRKQLPDPALPLTMAEMQQLPEDQRFLFNNEPEFKSGFCIGCSCRVTGPMPRNGCPNCGSVYRPCDDANQVTFSVNTHELRVLLMWAEQWLKCDTGLKALSKLLHAVFDRVADENAKLVMNNDDTIYSISLRLRKQLPDPAPPLTIADEFIALREAGYNIITNHPVADEP